VRYWTIISAILWMALSASAAQQYSATGMVLKVDRAHNSFTASCQEIPGFMAAMTMPFDVHQPDELNGLAPGTVVDFTLVVDSVSSYVEYVKIHPYISAEQDPRTARQLKLLTRLTGVKSGTKPLEIGSAVPNFTLTDQAHQKVSLSQFAGRVVAVNFIYTSCALPTFCYRMAK
jgi:protein SCO1/2